MFVGRSIAEHNQASQLSTQRAVARSILRASVG